MKTDVGRRQPVAVWLGLACLVLVVGLGGGCREQAPPSAQQSPRNRMNHDKAVFSVAYSPDGKTLASGSYPDIKLWDVATGKQADK